MFGIGETELVLIVLFAFMIFGPDKLPGMGRTLGRALRQFRNAQEGFTEVVQTNIMDPAAEAMSDNPKKPNRKRAEALEEDADLDAPEGERTPAPERHAETFAERKKRLAEEKKAREAAEAAAAAEADDDAPEPDEKSPNADAATGAAAEDSQPEPPAAKPSAADLYAMHPTTKPAPSESPVEPAAVGGAGGDGAVATHEVSDERSEERGANGAVPAGSANGAPTDEKEAE
ncbi:Sec-independent protein translocase subunit TatA/TatB [Thermophilibacter sp.]